jgi:two-component system, OmpR family, sensor kinase
VRLHGRIYLHSLAVLVVACVATALTFALGVRGAVRQDVAERVARHLASIAADVIDDQDALATRVRRMRDDLDIDVTVRGVDGRALAAVGRPLPPLSHEEAERVRRGSITLHSHRRWYTAVAVRKPGSETIVGFLQASTPHRFGPPQVLRPALTVVLILVVVALVTVPTARRISRPLERLTAAVRRLGGGDLATRVPATNPARGRRRWRDRHRGDELEELTRAFNEMADRVERLVRGQRELLANVSHELRSPLTRIRVALELLPADAASESRRRGLEADLADLERLIEDILTTARLDEAGLPTRLDALDARGVLADVAERARHDPLVEGKTIRVVDGPPIPLSADGALLRRAVWNLVENAAKYGAPPITLGAERAGDRVALSISDEGPGIPESERERVFTPFYRGDRGSVPGGTRGVGLGLTLARRVAEVHGGSIAVEAASVAGGIERGCRVVITLPADHFTA